MKKLSTILILAQVQLFLFVPSILSAKQPLSSSIRFVVEHPLKTVEGKCQRIQISDLNYSLQDGFRLLAPFSVTIEYRDLKTGNANRDSHMMEVLGFPDHRFVVANISEAKPSGTNLLISGSLTINGVSQPFQTTARFHRQGAKKDSVIIQGSTWVVLSQFKVPETSLLGMSIDERVQVFYQFILGP